LILNIDPEHREAHDILSGNFPGYSQPAATKDLIVSSRAALGKNVSGPIASHFKTSEIPNIQADIQLESIPEIPLFSDLSREACQKLVQEMTRVSLDSGEAVFLEGDGSEEFYLVLSGSFLVWKHEQGGKKEIARLEHGSFFGEMAFITGLPRYATVEAIEPSELFVIQPTTLRNLTNSYPQVGSAINRFYRERITANIMNSCQIFTHLTSEERQRLIRKFLVRDYTRGSEIIRQGAPGEGLYVIMNGKVEVFRGDDERSRRFLAILEGGEIFGELSLLYHQTTTANIAAIYDTRTLFLPRHIFHEAILHHPQMLIAVNEIAEQRSHYNDHVLTWGA
jgi:CRP-like cAMP-binding protein